MDLTFLTVDMGEMIACVSHVGERQLEIYAGTQVLHLGFSFFWFLPLEIPCIDYCHCDGVPPNVHVPSPVS